jgi:hypothetical protein
MDERRYDSRLREVTPLIEPHPSLPIGWDVHEGAQDLLRALTGPDKRQRQFAEGVLQLACMALAMRRHPSFDADAFREWWRQSDLIDMAGVIHE